MFKLGVQSPEIDVLERFIGNNKRVLKFVETYLELLKKKQLQQEVYEMIG
jgi:hypothetical protein